MRLSLLVLALVASVCVDASANSGQTHIRLITFNGENPWEASQTLYSPTADGLLHTDTIESFTKASSNACEDVLATHQKRSLDVMLSNRYITKSLYEQLTDPRLRAHKLSQYILATSFIELTEEEIRARGIKKERILDTVPNGKTRVHVGSLFFVRGYELERNGTGFRLKTLPLPWQMGKLAASLSKPLDRTNLTAAVEIGRALIEEGASRDEFPRLMQILGAALYADAQILKLDPREFALFGHSFDSQHLRLFALLFPARPMTDAMQLRLEADPREFFANYLDAPLPSKDEWKKFEDAISVGSLKALNDKFPAHKNSEYVHKFTDSLPAHISADKRMAMIREMAAGLRQDYDFKYHDVHRPGHRKPIQIRDFGTALVMVNMVDAVEHAGMPRTEVGINAGLKVLSHKALEFDPDFGHSEWFEKNNYIPKPLSMVQSDDMIPAIVVSNLDPKVPAKEMAAYLGTVLLGVTAKIEQRLKSLLPQDRVFVVNEMNEVRVKKGLPVISVAQVNLASFLETYELLFASGSEIINRELPILGGSPRKILRLHNPGQGGKMDIKIDPKKLGIDMLDLMKNPEKYAARLQAAAMSQMQGIFSESTAYRFRIEEVIEQQDELKDVVRMGAHHVLQESFHREKVLRLYISYQ